MRNKRMMNWPIHGGWIATAAGAAVLAVSVLSGSALAQTVKIGVVLTYSGPSASLGDQIDKGLSLYVKEHEKDLPAGVKVELIKRDDTGPNPDVAKRLAQELITRDHVQVLAGVVWSPNAAAIAPLATEAKIPFVIMNAAGAALTRASLCQGMVGRIGMGEVQVGRLLLGCEVLANRTDQFLFGELPFGNHTGEWVQEFRHKNLHSVIMSRWAGDPPPLFVDVS